MVLFVCFLCVFDILQLRYWHHQSINQYSDPFSDLFFMKSYFTYRIIIFIDLKILTFNMSLCNLLFNLFRMS